MKKIQKKSDSQLIKDYLSGKQEGFNVLIKRYEKSIYQKIYQKVQSHSLAEDILQEVLIKTIDSIKSKRYNEQGKFLPWVLRIANNMVIDYFRSQSKLSILKNTQDFDIFDVIASTDKNKEANIIDDEKKESLEKLLNRLPENQKQIVKMRFYQDMGFKEIAENLKISVNTAIGRLIYAIVNLRKMIKLFDIVFY